MVPDEASDALASSSTGAEAVSSSHLPFLIVGVGASAGGLEAFLELLKALPDQPGLSLLFVQHLQPSHKSQLAEILGKVTAMKVQEAEDGARIEANHVYIIRPISRWLWPTAICGWRRGCRTFRTCRPITCSGRWRRCRAPRRSA